MVYVGDGSEIQTSLINHFARQHRSAILVVDECSRKRHKALAEQLEVDSPVRLITIGDEEHIAASVSAARSDPAG